MNGRYSDNDPSRYDDGAYDGDDRVGDDESEQWQQDDDDDEIYDRNGNDVEETVEDDDDDDDDDKKEYNDKDGDLERDDDEDNEDDNEDDKENEGEDSGEEGEDSDEEGEEDEYDDEYDEEAYREEEYVEKGEDDGRARCLYVSLWCCCCLLIIFAVLIGILVSRRKKDRALDPTAAPTFVGGVSGGRNVPPFVESAPDGDTTIYKSGPLQSLPQGKEEIMLVQNGNSQDPNFPDTYALMNWYWDDVGYPWFNEDDLADFEVVGLLCLQHIPNTNEGATGGTAYSICRLPSPFPGEELETATSTGFNYIMPTDCMGQQKVDFDVEPEDETVCADVSPLISVHPPFVPSETSPSKRRGLQVNNFQNMLFMLDNIYSDQRATDEFYSKNAGSRSPTLRLTLTPKSGSGNGDGNGNGNGNEDGNGNGDGGDSSEQTGGSNSGSPSGPSAGGDGDNDNNTAPSVPGAPSAMNTPTISPAPTAPTISSAPSQSPEPSILSSSNIPCGVCGDGPAGVPLSNDFPVSIPADIAPPSVQGSATCAELEEICLAGECNPMVCAGMEQVRQECGCPGSGGPTLCGICPAQTVITKPDEDILELLSTSVPAETLAAAGDNVTCANFDQLCQDGLCGADVCISVPELVREPCGCTATDGNAPTSVPINGPTNPPSTSGPTVSQAPTYKAEFGVCGICGVGPTPNVLNDTPIKVPDHLAPPQIKDGEASCAELESYCQEGYCRPLTCRVLEPIRGICGCPNADPPCSICGPGKVISITDAPLNLDPSIAVPGFGQSVTCGELNDLCANGYCDSSRCDSFLAVATQTCGCTDTVPNFVISSAGDTTIYRDGALKTDSFGEEDTMLVQRGVSGNEGLPPAFSILEFTISDTSYQEVQRLGFATIELCLHHVESTEADRVMTYSTCVVADVDGGVEDKSGESVILSMPGSCNGGSYVDFTVSPTTGRVCTTVTKMFKAKVTAPSTITFLIDAMNDSDQPGDRFYTQEDTSGRQPVLQFVDRPYQV